MWFLVGIGSFRSFILIEVVEDRFHIEERVIKVLGITCIRWVDGGDIGGCKTQRFQLAFRVKKQLKRSDHTYVAFIVDMRPVATNEERQSLNEVK